MYGESSFTWEYVCGYETREQRKKRQFRRAGVLSVLLCLAGLVTVFSMRLAEAGGLDAFTGIVEKGQTIYEEAQTAYDGAAVQAVYTVEGQALHAVGEQAVLVVQMAVSGMDEAIRPLVEAEHVPLIYLDPGHGGADEGCARDGVLEKDLNLSIALLVREKLKAQGYEVMMSRETDSYISKEDRVKEANQSGADIYISIHQNATEDGTGVCGMEVWYEGDDAGRDSRRLAQLIQQQTVKSTGAVERELRGDADFHVTGSTSMPACLIETGFLSNAAERRRLGLFEYQEKIAEGIVQGGILLFSPQDHVSDL